MAKNDESATTGGIIAVTPPAQQRRGRGQQIPAEDIAAAVAMLDEGQFPSDGVSYHVDHKDDAKMHQKSRAKANSVAIKYRKALVNSPDNDYNDPKMIRTRVWEDEPGQYRWCLVKRNGDDE